MKIRNAILTTLMLSGILGIMAGIGLSYIVTLDYVTTPAVQRALPKYCEPQNEQSTAKAKDEAKK